MCTLFAVGAQRKRRAKVGLRAPQDCSRVARPGARLLEAFGNSDTTKQGAVSAVRIQEGK